MFKDPHFDSCLNIWVESLPCEWQMHKSTGARCYCSSEHCIFPFPAVLSLRLTPRSRLGTSSLALYDSSVTIVLRQWSEVSKRDYPVMLLILYSGTGIGHELAFTPRSSFSNDGSTAVSPLHLLDCNTKHCRPMLVDQARTQQCHVLTQYRQDNSVNPSMPALQVSLLIFSITDGLYSHQWNNINRILSVVIGRLNRVVPP
ncbi:hypothetical protein K439DRAFT_1611711 [Ramaria rubella]|nr:hypothetical protein K439DRAFT_1611711 [Ramaria rubella]